MSNRGRVRRSVDTAPAADTPERDDALGDWPAPTQETSVEQVPVGDIDDPEWRAPVDTADPAYRALKASVRASGILQPLLVRRTAQGGLQVVSGMRRLRAAREMGQEAVPATVQELTEVQAIVGAWDALVRERATVDGRDAIERRLLDGGMPPRDVAGLLASLTLAEAVAASGPAAPVAAEPARRPSPPRPAAQARRRARPGTLKLAATALDTEAQAAAAETAVKPATLDEATAVGASSPVPAGFVPRRPSPAEAPSEPRQHESPSPAAPVDPPEVAPSPHVISIALPGATPSTGDGPTEPVVVAPRTGPPLPIVDDEPITALPGPAARAALVSTLADWRTGATVGTFVFVLCVVYIILIVLLGSTTLLVPALVLALLGGAAAVGSMARSRWAP